MNLAIARIIQAPTNQEQPLHHWTAWFPRFQPLAQNLPIYGSLKKHTVGSTTTPGTKQPLSLDLHQASLLTKVPWDLVTTWPRPITHAFHLDLNIWGQFLKEVQSQATCLSFGGSGRCCITFLSWACPQPHFWLFCLSRSSWQDKIRGANTYDCHFHSAAAQMPKPERNAD